jgi:hypothetical protein
MQQVFIRSQTPVPSISKNKRNTVVIGHNSFSISISLGISSPQSPMAIGAIVEKTCPVNQYDVQKADEE